jgi:protein-disulfide isomerase
VRTRVKVGAVAAAIVVGIAAGCGGGDDSSDNGDNGGEVEGAAEVNELLAGVPQSGATLGDTNATVEIVEYGDMQCPFCAQASEELTPDLLSEFVEPGTAKLTYVPLAFIGEDSERGAIAVEAAAAQDKAWEMTEILFANQGDENSGWLSDDLIFSVAEAGGLDVEQFRVDFEGDAAAEAIFANQSRATDSNVSSTPTYVVEGPNGTEVISGAQGVDAFEEAIAEVS